MKTDELDVDVETLQDEDDKVYVGVSSLYDFLNIAITSNDNKDAKKLLKGIRSFIMQIEKEAKKQ